MSLQDLTSTNTMHANILAQALPFIQRFHGKTMVIKYGGNAMTEPALQQAFAQDVVLLKLIGVKPVVVHGGGPQIERLLNKIGKKGAFIQGMRITDSETMQAVEWALAGEVQQTIVGNINAAGGRAVGLTGRDGNLILARKMQLRDLQNPDLEHDIGQVGTVDTIDPRLIHTLEDNQYIPVITPIGYGVDNQRYNINADIVASHLAIALQAEKLLMLSNIAGVLNRSGEHLAELSAQQINTLIANGTISGGMLPKIVGALDAAQAGVQAVHIVDGRIPHALLLEILTDLGSGTMIYNQ